MVQAPLAVEVIVVCASEVNAIIENKIAIAIVRVGMVVFIADRQINKK